ncbi:hypothetical protein JOF56_009775 [Kibdelosporangium banguiense]|uniref:Pyridoxamine 5'-phosphate oxidase N-terminal domain-containing protein n=1 Tax=Kibdelosporangium banguiense TaxID=1365924 RepID=A0ABS4TZQ0_9PSEU|nr:pyridoxamine 5'-phosphate oxidase family protein [Kibdelosporangium banguiense]MBP2329390.1 hypothetical protein [Kibdelosporangium banguiense]
MHETPEDLRRTQALIDDSHGRAGAHLRSIMSDPSRISAEELSGLLTGVQVLNVATVTAAGQPRVAPVDGLFYRGQFWFGSSHDSVRFRHLRRRPAISATHTRGEALAVIVHGTAHEVDLGSAAGGPFRDYCLEVYGQDWYSWGAPAAYARIDAEKMFTFRSRH